MKELTKKQKHVLANKKYREKKQKEKNTIIILNKLYLLIIILLSCLLIINFNSQKIMKKLNKILQTYNKVNLKLKEASFNASTCDLFTARHEYNQRMVKLFYIVLKMFKYWQNLIDNADLKRELVYRLESGGVYEIEQILLKIKRGI